MSYDVKLLIIC